MALLIILIYLFKAQKSVQNQNKMKGNLVLSKNHHASLRFKFVLSAGWCVCLVGAAVGLRPFLSASVFVALQAYLWVVEGLILYVGRTERETLGNGPWIIGMSGLVALPVIMITFWIPFGL